MLCLPGSIASTPDTRRNKSGYCTRTVHSGTTGGRSLICVVRYLLPGTGTYRYVLVQVMRVRLLVSVSQILVPVVAVAKY